jgi:DnaK suppressor protein
VPGRDLETPRQELQRRRRTILETARRADAELDALRAAERDPEFEEEAQTEGEHRRLDRLSEAQRLELERIDAALARAEAGRYGSCVECSGEIEARRLAALPHALRCAACAELDEAGPPGRVATRSSAP